jgi:hypothetical protein
VVTDSQIYLPSVYSTLTKNEQAAVSDVIEVLISMPSVECLFWGGSTAYSNVRDLADVDLWLVVQEADSVYSTLQQQLASVPHARVVYNSGFLPWLGRLLTVLFFHGCTFSIDIGVCQREDLAAANPGPKPFPVWGDTSAAFALLRPQRYEVPPEQRVATLLINLIKIRKNLLRGYLWEAYECLSRARREIMGLLLPKDVAKRIYYSRADRDIEDYVTTDVLKALELTAPAYSCSAIATAAVQLCSGAIQHAFTSLPDAYREELMALQNDFTILQQADR